MNRVLKYIKSRKLHYYLTKSKDEINNLSKNEIQGLLNSNNEKDILEFLTILGNISYLDFLDNDEIRIKGFMSIMNGKITKMDDFSLAKTLESIENDDIKLKYIDLIQNDYYRYSVMCSFKSENKKIQNILLIEGLFYKKRLLETIQDDSILIEFYKNCSAELKLFTVMSINDDKIKESYLNDFMIFEQSDLICTFKNDLLKKKYALSNEHNKYKADIISSIKDEQFIKKQFLQDDSILFKLTLIKEVRQRKMLLKNLIELLDPSIYKQVFETNKVETKERILENIKLENINYNVDENITIGVELETHHENAKLFVLLEKILVNWDIKSELSIIKGVELSSPILRFDVESLKQLYYICSFLKENKFYVDESCGGHIHLGFDYIKTLSQLQIFLNLYSKVEDILYVLSNKEGTNCRRVIHKQAPLTNGFFEKLLYYNKDKIASLGDAINIMKDTQFTRYLGLNLKNIGENDINTIEFRFPNGEIDFNEIVYNIKLLTKFLQITKEILKNEDEDLIDDYTKLLYMELDNDQKVGILLGMLFKDEKEKQVYLKRYNSNKSEIYKLKIYK